jgi:hypothetical protein
VVIGIVGIVRNEFVGWAYFTLKGIRFLILVATATTHGARFSFGHVLKAYVASFAVVCGNMFRDVGCLVEQELARGASFAGC